MLLCKYRGLALSCWDLPRHSCVGVLGLQYHVWMFFLATRLLGWLGCRPRALVQGPVRVGWARWDVPCHSLPFQLCLWALLTHCSLDYSSVFALAEAGDKFATYIKVGNGSE